MSDFNKATARDCPSNLMNAMGLFKVAANFRLRILKTQVKACGYWVTLMQYWSQVSLIIFSGQSLALLLKESLNLGPINFGKLMVSERPMVYRP